METTATRSDAILRTLNLFDAARRSEKHHSRLPIIDLSVRNAGETGDGSLTVSGHAATTSSEYVLYENDLVRVRERISADAFNEVLAGNPDVHLNINHDMSKAIARTGITGVGGLELSMDNVGLRFFARVDPEDPDVIGLRSKMRIGVISQSSFAFTIAKETRTETEDGDRIDVLYEIGKVGNLYDVCVCAQGANPQTDSSLRSLEAALGRDAIASGQDHRGLEPGVHESIIATQDTSGGGVSTRVLVAQAKAKARSARSHFPTKDQPHA